jgi:hypothetical protein
VVSESYRTSVIVTVLVEDAKTRSRSHFRNPIASVYHVTWRCEQALLSHEWFFIFIFHFACEWWHNGRTYDSLNRLPEPLNASWGFWRMFLKPDSGLWVTLHMQGRSSVSRRWGTFRVQQTIIHEIVLLSVMSIWLLPWRFWTLEIKCAMIRTGSSKQSQLAPTSWQRGGPQSLWLTTTTLRSTSVASCSLCCSMFTDFCHPDEGGARFLRNVGSYKSHTA